MTRKLEPYVTQHMTQKITQTEPLPRTSMVKVYQECVVPLYHALCWFRLFFRIYFPPN